MKIKLLIPILKDGKRHNEGDEINLSHEQAKLWIAKKWAKSIIEKKESKIKKETKELKLDSKETKNEASKN